MRAINQEIRSWHMQLKNDKSLEDLSKMFNPKVRGWFAYGVNDQVNSPPLGPR
ncbi:MAG: hypothetical protein JRI35_08225 [Deltaproteobacteria bacterium]|nr:hypothetical protein [Deltaproteobacteria bacterium]